MPRSLQTLTAAAVVLLTASCGTREESAPADGSQQSGVTYSDAPTVAPAPARPEIELRRQAKLAETSAAADQAGAVGAAVGTSAERLTAQAAAPPAPPAFGPPQILTNAANAMIIRTGQVSIEVTALDSAVARLRQIAASLGGYVANSSFAGGEQQIRSATLELKVPAARFDGAIGMLRGVGEVEGESVQAQDVGEEFVDVTARVANGRRLESRLTELLATRTGRLQDVLSVERELARVREEIERYEGRLRFLQARTAVSTIAVTVHEPPPVLVNSPGRNPIGEAFRDAWRNFVALTAALIAAMGVLIPLALVAALAWMGWRKYGPRPMPPKAASEAA
jgi:hypothetical protein